MSARNRSRKRQQSASCTKWWVAGRSGRRAGAPERQVAHRGADGRLRADEPAAAPPVQDVDVGVDLVVPGGGWAVGCGLKVDRPV